MKLSRPDLFRRRNVLEIGSYNINGTPREFFDECDYTGLDWRAGPQVDKVGFGHEQPTQDYDLVLCLNTLEHDAYWEKTLEAIGKSPHAIVTVASFDYPEHHPESGVGKHYRNVQPEEIALPGTMLFWELDRIQGEVRFFHAK